MGRSWDCLSQEATHAIISIAWKARPSYDDLACSLARILRTRILISCTHVGNLSSGRPRRGCRVCTAYPGLSEAVGVAIRNRMVSP